jgi:DtxR family transcriptional regulator, Mn-dependent transcriptional regulator
MEDYLKAIYTLQQEHEGVTTSMLGERLGGIKPGSVTGMLKKLHELNLVTYTPYQGVRLSDAGEKIALEVIRHHRLIELYLVEALGYGWDEVHEEAEQLEHYISAKFAARIAALLGQPVFDPHGDPIPTIEGVVPGIAETCLADMSVGEEARIVRVCEQDGSRLRYIGDMGLLPGVQVRVTASAPFDGPLSVQVGQDERTLDRRLAQKILVES